MTSTSNGPQINEDILSSLDWVKLTVNVSKFQPNNMKSRFNAFFSALGAEFWSSAAVIKVTNVFLSSLRLSAKHFVTNFDGTFRNTQEFYIPCIVRNLVVFRLIRYWYTICTAQNIAGNLPETGLHIMTCGAKLRLCSLYNTSRTDISLEVRLRFLNCF